MFGRHMEIKFVKTKKEQVETPDKSLTKDDYIDIVGAVVGATLVGVVTIMTTNFIFGTATHLIVQKTGKISTE